MAATVLIVAGYVALIVAFGWPGIIAAGIHIGVMLLALPRK